MQLNLKKGKLGTSIIPLARHNHCYHFGVYLFSVLKINACK